MLLAIAAGAVAAKKIPSQSPAAATADKFSGTVAGHDIATASEPENNERAERTEAHSLSSLFPRMRSAPDLAALLALADLPNDLSNAVGHLTDNQCLQAFQRLQAQPASEARDRVLIAILTSYAEKDRPTSLVWLAGMAGPEMIGKAWEDESFQLLWSRERPEETTRWLVDQGPRFLDSARLTYAVAFAANYWGHNDQRVAAEFMARLPADMYAKAPVTTALRTVCREWSIFDGPPTVLAWTETLSADDPRRTAAVLGALDQMAHTDPERSKAFVRQRLGIDKDAVQMAAAIAADMAVDQAGDLEGEARWVLSLPDPDARRAALNSLIAEWITAVDYKAVGSGGIPAAATWAASLPSNEERGAAWGAVAAYWKTLRPEEGKNWLDSLPDGVNRNEAIAIYENPSLPTSSGARGFPIRR